MMRANGDASRLTSLTHVQVRNGTIQRNTGKHAFYGDLLRMDSCNCGSIMRRLITLCPWLHLVIVTAVIVWGA